MNIPEMEFQGETGRKFFTAPINRMQYFERILPVAVIYVAFTNGNWVRPEYHGLAVLTAMSMVVLRCLFAGQRCRDIGWNPWLSLLTLIPVVGLVVGVTLLIKKGRLEAETPVSQTVAGG